VSDNTYTGEAAVHQSWPDHFNTLPIGCHRVSTRLSGWVLSVLVLFSASLFSSTSAAEPVVVFAVDAAMQSSERDAAKATIRSIQDRLPESTETELVVFDDVVQKLVERGINDSSQRNEIDEVLSSLKAADTSSMAAGMERSYDAAKDNPGSTVLLFSRAQIDSESEVGKSRHKDWLDLVLLPDARDAEITVGLFTPEQGADEAIVNSVISHSLNTHTLLTAEAGVPASLTRLIPGITTMGELLGSTVIVAGDATQDQDEGKSEDSASATTDTTESPAIDQSAGQQWLKYLWTIALASLAILLLFLLVWVVKSRGAKERSAGDMTTGTSSTYLPLDAEPTTGGFTTRGESTDIAVPDDDWTLPAETKEQDEFLARTLPNIDERDSFVDVDEPQWGQSATTEDETVLRPDTNRPQSGAQEIVDESEDKTRLRPVAPAAESSASVTMAALDSLDLTNDDTMPKPAIPLSHESDQVTGQEPEHQPDDDRTRLKSEISAPGRFADAEDDDSTVPRPSINNGPPIQHGTEEDDATRPSPATVADDGEDSE